MKKQKCHDCGWSSLDGHVCSVDDQRWEVVTEGEDPVLVTRQIERFVCSRCIDNDNTSRDDYEAMHGPMSNL